ncbi:hypothetical protein [Mesonia sp.]|uniref:hypothetical protein n=1 Tax=Mesonia sp. TaxID=1960830 RepID=UPI003F9B8034
MNNYQHIQQKLEGFIRKFYINELLKGVILFFAIGLIYFLMTVFLEYFLWLSSLGRGILFWLFIGVEVALFIKFILIPVSKLFKLSRGISHEEASQMIGKHFPQVDDKLLNVLQLQKEKHLQDSDLLLASIDQKSKELQPVPFTTAINFKSNVGYLKYAIIPLAIFLAIYISGNEQLFSDSYARVVNYEREYEPPAAFAFQLDESKLQVKENEQVSLKITTQGKVIPETAKIHINGKEFVLKQVSPGVFEYTFTRIKKNTNFYLSSNEVTSKPYQIEVTQVPTLVDFKMHLDYPAYINQPDEVMEGTGNATIPEGTKVKWQLTTNATDEVRLDGLDSLYAFKKQNHQFVLEKSIYNSSDYAVVTSNASLKDYEKLYYSLKVIKDQFPSIQVEKKEDSTQSEIHYFKGVITDDHAITNLQIVYYPVRDRKNLKTKKLPFNGKDYAEFFYQFPNELELEKGVPYEFYFIVTDNDAVHHYKSKKSKVFGYQLLTNKEEKERNLENQENAMQGMSESLQEMKSRNKQLKELDQSQREKKQLNYQDKEKLKNFTERQRQQDELMKSYTEKMKQNLEELKTNDPLKKELEKRLEKSQEEMEKDNKLLEELEKYQEKLNKEDLHKKMEELSKRNTTQQKSLEQLLELTKRYYVEQKAEKIASDLQELAKEQEKLSLEEKENTSKAQEELNKEFEDIQKQMDELEKENEKLKSPMDIPREESQEDAVKEDQEEAKENLEKSEKEEGKESAPSKKSAQKKQQSAAEKMKQMSQKMKSAMAQGGQEQLEEDAEMLRQILENLMSFSFEQEDLMLQFEKLNDNSPRYVRNLKQQQTLKENFKHVDDSLFGLASRNPMISENITSVITDINFNIDKALERFADNQIPRGVASQQYVFKGANDLANMLNESLEQMQMQMNAQGEGEGSSGKGKEGEGQGAGFQLKDIIKKQGELGEEAGEKGKKPGEGTQGQSPNGKKPGAGKGGEQGEGGQNPGEGKDGNQGENGQQPGEGKPGSQGENGERGGNGESEKMSKELFEIFKEQQSLRMQLNDIIKQQNLGPEAKRLSRAMEHIEDELLTKGITKNTGTKMKQIEHRLLEMENAMLQQGEEQKRTSETNDKDFTNEASSLKTKAKDYFNTTEILNRQALPLQKNYQEIVKEYFTEKE